MVGFTALNPPYVTMSRMTVFRVQGRLPVRMTIMDLHPCDWIPANPWPV